MSSPPSPCASPLENVPRSESPPIPKTPHAPKDENATKGTRPTLANDDIAQRQIHPQPGVLIVTLPEAVGISLPEHYKQLLKTRSHQQGTGPGPNTGSTTTSVYLDTSGSHGSKTDSRFLNAPTPKKHTSGVYALLDFDKSQLLVHASSGTIRVSVDFSKTKTPLQQDFDLLMALGCGSSGSVFEALKKDSRRLYALKTIQTIGVVPQGEVAGVFEIAKRSILSQIRNPFLVPIKFVFQTPKSLFLASPFIHSEELIRLLFTEQCFDVERIRLYTAEILCALESLHDSGIIYGDLKPQNVLLDYSGHISICDFGLCKLNVSCTSPYAAPEIKLGQAYTEVVDWWTLGILLAEMLTGFGPSWYDDNISGMDSKIESFYFPDPNVVPPPAQDISIKLFNRDPEQRLGAKGVAEIKAHPFFDNINWHRILEREYEPIFKPNNSFMRTDIAYKGIDFLPMPDEDAKKQSDRRMEQFRRLFVGCDQRAFRGLKEEGNSPN